MAWAKWDDAEWRAHEAAQCRAYIAGRDRMWRDDQFRCCMEALLTRAEIVDANRAAALAVEPESSARVYRLLQEQKAWDGYLAWRMSDGD